MKLIAYVLSFDIGKIVIKFACFNSMLVGAFKRVFVRTISHYQTLRHVCRKVGGGGGGHGLNHTVVEMKLEINNCLKMFNYHSQAIQSQWFDYSKTLRPRTCIKRTC